MFRKSTFTAAAALMALLAAPAHAADIEGILGIGRTTAAGVFRWRYVGWIAIVAVLLAALYAAWPVGGGH